MVVRAVLRYFLVLLGFVGGGSMGCYWFWLVGFCSVFFVAFVFCYNVHHVFWDRFDEK